MSEDFIVEISSLAAGGDGVGRLPDGRVVFVPWSAPGDRLKVRLTEEKRRFTRGRIREILSPGPNRREPPCPVAGQCGGCRWQHLDYAAQLDAKATILRDAIERIAGLTVPGELEIVPSPELGYRGRARVLAEGGLIGFRKLQSHDVCGIRHCPVLTEGLDGMLAEIASDPPAGPAEWLLAQGDDGHVSVRTRGPGARADAITLELAGDKLRIGPGVFFQANAHLRERLAQAVHGAAGSGQLALELYAGAGFFTLGLARRFHKVVAVELAKRAVRDLEHNLRAAGVADHVEVQARDAGDALAKPPEGAPPDVVVLDPPRTGLPKRGAQALGALGAPRVVYLSCDPATLARDLRTLAEHGYHLEDLQAFDLFPQTSHLESLAVMAKR